MEKVSLLSVNSYDDIKQHINKSIDLIGGFSSIVSNSDKVLLKPNFITARPPEAAVNTHPEFIAATAEILLDYGCKVTIGDSPGIGSGKEVAKKLGLFERLSKHNVEFIDFEESVLADINDDYLEKRNFKHIHIAKELENFDKVINLPKLKSHAQMGITLATKNLFGCIVGRQKGQWHFSAGRDLLTFARLIVEIALIVNASVHILDGVWGMDGNGPTNGRKRNTNVILSSQNSIALDRIVIELIGKKPSQFPIFEAAKDMGLYGIDLSQIDILGDKINDCKIDNFQIPSMLPVRFIKYKFLSNFVKKLVNQRIKLDKKKCIDCKKCEEICPANAIGYNNGINIHHDLCIKCCCCQEICPVGALSVYDPVPLKVLKKFGF